MPTRFRNLVGLGVVAVAVVAAQSPRPLTLVDMITMPQISDPQLSPDLAQQRPAARAPASAK
jgi:hypothetical protein